ncbi:hypothetical protein DPEC_G00023670 [Dallia pectoralis]|uniref:Uncharacterized protein n=1 Tax=Dallia pectoralis TaxID=75939 RepID=A0ACC2HHP4_DALPE|nr:hypothetical protein DPEC_G00023670 [Dallia pectoralis]
MTARGARGQWPGESQNSRSRQSSSRSRRTPRPLPPIYWHVSELTASRIFDAIRSHIPFMTCSDMDSNRVPREKIQCLRIELIHQVYNMLRDSTIERWKLSRNSKSEPTWKHLCTIHTDIDSLLEGELLFFERVIEH